MDIRLNFLKKNKEMVASNEKNILQRRWQILHPKVIMIIGTN